METDSQLILNFAWVRGNDHISFNKANTWLVLGTRGSGKSSLLENLAMKYLDEGHCVLDLFGSRDGEGLAWLRSPYAENRRVLILHGEGIEAETRQPCDFKPTSKLELNDFQTYDIIISASPLYRSHEDEFRYAAKIMNTVYQRLHWRRLVFGIVREASNLYYSRLRIADNQAKAKSEMIYLIREARHVGLSLGLDTLRFFAVDIDVRNLCDYLVLKSQGLLGLSDDLRWLYSYFEPKGFTNMPPKYFVVLTKNGAVGLGYSKEVDWHKKEQENILTSIGLKVTRGEAIDQGKDLGTFMTVGSEEHARMIQVYIEDKIGYVKIAKRLSRSPATIMGQMDRHNQSIERNGYCLACRQVKSQYESTPASRMKQKHQP